MSKMKDPRGRVHAAALRPASEPAAAAGDDAVEKAFAALKGFDWGQDRNVLKALDDAVVKSHGDAAAEKALADRLASRLGTDVSRCAKDIVLRALSLVGSAAVVARLAKLLTDDDLSHMARYALERMTCQESLEALRAALPKTSGRTAAGIIDSLGVRRDNDSVPALAKLASSADRDVAGGAIAALGKIGSPEAARALAAVAARPLEGLEVTVREACLDAAERLVRCGEKGAARKLCKALRSSGPPDHVKKAAKKVLQGS